jgi:hypothetical protein
MTALTSQKCLENGRDGVGPTPRSTQAGKIVSTGETPSKLAVHERITASSEVNLWSAVEARLQDFPKRYQETYRKAMSGRSKVAAIKAHCLMCVGYSAKEVRACTARACPLYPYRPGARIGQWT